MAARGSLDSGPDKKYQTMMKKKLVAVVYSGSLALTLAILLKMVALMPAQLFWLKIATVSVCFSHKCGTEFSCILHLLV